VTNCTYQTNKQNKQDFIENFSSLELVSFEYLYTECCHKMQVKILNLCMILRLWTPINKNFVSDIVDAPVVCDNGPKCLYIFHTYSLVYHRSKRDSC
jgi:hypothetical protein